MRKILTIITLSFVALSCNLERAIDKIEITSVKTGFMDYRATIFYPAISIKVKNISKKELYSFLIEVYFIDKTNNEQLYRTRETVYELRSGMNKTVTFRSNEGLPYSGKNIRKFLLDSNIVCEIYIDGQLYNEIKIEGTLFI